MITESMGRVGFACGSQPLSPEACQLLMDGQKLLVDSDLHVGEITLEMRQGRVWVRTSVGHHGFVTVAEFGAAVAYFAGRRG